MSLLEARNLTVSCDLASDNFCAVRGIDLSVDVGEVLATVRKSGSGKSVAILAVTGLLPQLAHVGADVRRFDGADLLGLSPKKRRRLVGKDMAMNFQEEPVTIAMATSGKPRLIVAGEPTTALDVTIQKQILDLLMRLRSEGEAVYPANPFGGAVVPRSMIFTGKMT